MKRVFVAGHKGMVGSAIVRQLSEQNDVELIVRDRTQLNLLNQAETYHAGFVNILLQKKFFLQIQVLSQLSVV